MNTRGISAATLSRNIGLNPKTISDWKVKGTNPSADNLMCICTFLRVSPEYLLTGNKKSPSSDLKDDELRLLYMYNLLSDMEKGELLGELKCKTANSKNFINVSEA